MNNSLIKKMRKLYRKSIKKKATGKYGFEILRLARNRDILGVLLTAASAAIIALSILLFQHW